MRSLRRAVVTLPATIIVLLSAWATVPARAASAGPSIVEIIAHEDDDLLYQHPELVNGLKASLSTTTIYLTAGENTASSRGSISLLDYVHGRQTGVKLAYAQMAGVSCSTDTNCWTRTEDTVAGHVVEHFTMIQKPKVQLYFLDLPDQADGSFNLGTNTLRQLWGNGALSADTLTMSNSGKWPQHYTRAGLIAVLNALLTSTQATLVRMQDPAPDPFLTAELPLPEHDNPDHISAAWFADAAVGQYAAVAPRVLTDHFRNINIQDTPANLSGAATAEKRFTFDSVYRPHDPLLPPQQTSCDVNFANYECWESRQQYRMPRSSQAAAADARGALHAFAVEGGSVFEWAENSAKTWQGPTVRGNPGGPLVPGLAVGHDLDGRLEVIGQRADTGAIVSGGLSAAGVWTWQSLGSPEPSDPNPLLNYALQVSAPAVASNGDGRLQVFVRNAGGGLSSLAQTSPNGPWGTDWTDLGGNGIQEAPSAITNQDGRIEVFAWSMVLPTRSDGSFQPLVTSSVQHWFQHIPNQGFIQNTGFPSVSPTSAVTAGMDHDGRLELLYRQLDGLEPITQTANNYTMTIWQTSVGGTWAAGSGPLSGGRDQGGLGPAAVVTPGDGHMIAAVRNRGGGVSLSRQGANGAFGAWTDLRGPNGSVVLAVPAVAVDRDGLADLVGIALDGRLYDNRQQSDGSFGGWNPMGSS